MKTIGRFALAALAGSALTLAVWALPPKAPNSAAAAPQAQVSLESVSGIIAAVQNSSFTLTTSAGTPGGQQLMAERTPKSMTFMIDDNTAVDGQISVGANASVVYRQDNGNNLAVSVSVAK